MRLASVLLGVGVLAVNGCSSADAPPSKPETPAHVEAARPEGQLTTVRLSAEAVKRLGIETAVGRTESAAGTRSLGGEVTVPEGRLITVTAPLAGTITGANSDDRVGNGSCTRTHRDGRKPRRLRD